MMTHHCRECSIALTLEEGRHWIYTWVKKKRPLWSLLSLAFTMPTYYYSILLSTAINRHAFSFSERPLFVLWIKCMRRESLCPLPKWKGVEPSPNLSHLLWSLTGKGGRIKLLPLSKIALLLRFAARKSWCRAFLFAAVDDLVAIHPNDNRFASELAHVVRVR